MSIEFTCNDQSGLEQTGEDDHLDCCRSRRCGQASLNAYRRCFFASLTGTRYFFLFTLYSIHPFTFTSLLFP